MYIKWDSSVLVAAAQSTLTVTGSVIPARPRIRLTASQSVFAILSTTRSSTMLRISSLRSTEAWNAMDCKGHSYSPPFPIIEIHDFQLQINETLRDPVSSDIMISV
ncbi:hypothetical protein BDV33DRAFT_167672 [Aspergillus novoparasiticus]|uniref:Uncharacterized protein n=1 Tax=Aspergillus novoparasiticus TaxID=986946 RepID=A0A5N6F227_9EURO|nr:hypothetical protein BDV33DRAFT_167672 [Aspergillus novoparasiticus]